MVVPVDSAVKLTTFSAENDLCEAVIAGEDALPAGWTCVDYPPANKLGLHFHEEFLRNDGFMIVLDVVLWHRAVVLDTLDDLTIGGTITWNVNTMKYEVAGATLANTTRKVTVSNRSDLPVYAFATVTDQDAGDGITVAAEKDSATNKLTIEKATAGTAVANGTPTTGELTINVTSGDWNAVAEYYAAKRLNSPNQATDTFPVATVTVTISKD